MYTLWEEGNKEQSLLIYCCYMPYMVIGNMAAPIVIICRVKSLCFSNKLRSTLYFCEACIKVKVCHMSLSPLSRILFQKI